MDDPQPLIFINRTYTLDVLRLTDAQTHGLDQVYRSLPAFAGYPLPDQCPVWFGPVPVDPNTPSIPYLSASVEPSGLHVAGWMTADAWVRWEAQFLDTLWVTLGLDVHDAESS